MTSAIPIANKKFTLHKLLHTTPHTFAGAIRRRGQMAGEVTAITQSKMIAVKKNLFGAFG